MSVFRRIFPREGVRSKEETLFDQADRGGPEAGRDGDVWGRPDPPDLDHRADILQVE